MKIKISRFKITFSNGTTNPLGETTEEKAKEEARAAAARYNDPGLILSEIGVGPLNYN